MGDFNATQLYHATNGVRVVRSQAEADALGPDWFDSPKKATAAAADADTPPATPPTKRATKAKE